MRITAEQRRAVSADAPSASMVQRRVTALVPGCDAEAFEVLGELRADRHHRIECRHRLLWDERDVAAEQSAPARGRKAHQVLTVELQARRR